MCKSKGAELIWGKTKFQSEVKRRIIMCLRLQQSTKIEFAYLLNNALYRLV